MKTTVAEKMDRKSVFAVTLYKNSDNVAYVQKHLVPLFYFINTIMLPTSKCSATSRATVRLYPWIWMSVWEKDKYKLESNNYRFSLS